MQLLHGGQCPQMMTQGQILNFKNLTADPKFKFSGQTRNLLLSTRSNTVINLNQVYKMLQRQGRSLDRKPIATCVEIEAEKMAEGLNIKYIKEKVGNEGVNISVA